MLQCDAKLGPKARSSNGIRNSEVDDIRGRSSITGRRAAAQLFPSEEQLEDLLEEDSSIDRRGDCYNLNIAMGRVVRKIILILILLARMHMWQSTRSSSQHLSSSTMLQDI